MRHAGARCARLPWRGGGFSGVETIGAINDFLREVAPHYRKASAEPPTLVLIEPMERLLPEFDTALGEYTASKLSAARHRRALAHEGGGF